MLESYSRFLPTQPILMKFSNSTSTRTAALAALLLLSQPTFAESYSGRVVRIADGDTVTVLDESNTEHKVRLAGIDAPEKKQPFGNVSRQHLASMVFGKTVIVETAKFDRYGREVGTVIVADVDANLEQIRAGLAWHYKEYEREQEIADRKTYAAEEDEARTARRGLWRDGSAVPPWEYRRQRRGQ